MFIRSKTVASNISELKSGPTVHVLYRRDVIWLEAYILTSYSAFEYNTKL